MLVGVESSGGAVSTRGGTVVYKVNVVIEREDKPVPVA